MKKFADRLNCEFRISGSEHRGRFRTASRYLDCFAVDAKAWEQCAGQINARGAARHSDGLWVKQRLPEGIDGVDVRLGAPARTATPRGVCAKLTSVPATILPSAIRSLRPSLDIITMSAGTPRRSCAPMVSGPLPCDAPEPVVTAMPVVRSNSGKADR